MATKVFSLEDADTSKVSLVSTRKVIYKDLDLSFTSSDVGNIFKKTEAAAVKQAVKTLLSSNRFDKPFDPDFGVDLRSFLFELADKNTGGEITQRIKETIESYEPRAAVRSIRVGVQEDINAVNVLMTFQVRNTTQTVTFETTISRLR